jgi:hypothetical protein
MLLFNIVLAGFTFSGIHVSQSKWQQKQRHACAAGLLAKSARRPLAAIEESPV